MTALILGAVLALAALAFVLYPLLAPPAPGRMAPRPAAEPDPGGAGLTPERERALAALQEIEFEHATGKLSDADYERLRAEYAPAAAPAPGAGVDADDPVEGFIRAYRSRQTVCAVCGPRPEPDARYCSTCGRDLGGACPRCGARPADPDARFCASCGAPLTSA